MERGLIRARENGMKQRHWLTIYRMAVMRAMRSIRSIPLVATLANRSHEPVTLAGRLPDARCDATPETILIRMCSHTGNIVLMCSGHV